MRLRDFQVLSFDCYGTLIDWDTGLIAAVAPLVARAARAVDALRDFAAMEAAVQAANPTLLYTDVLASVHARLAAAWGVPPDVAADRILAKASGIGRHLPIPWPRWPF